MQGTQTTTRNGVLFVSPSAKDAESLSEMLQALSIPLVHARTLSQARRKLDGQDFGVVLTEADLPDGNWKDVLTLARGEVSGSEVVVTTPQADTGLWLDVLESGAYDLVCQPFCSFEVQRILSNALSERRDVPHACHAAL